MIHQDGYSAAVDIRLVAGETIFDVAQVGRDSLLLHEYPAVAAGFGRGMGKVVITVDGHEHVHDVFINQGIQPDSLCVTFG